MCIVVKKIWGLGAPWSSKSGTIFIFPRDIQVRENAMNFRQLSVSQSWFLASAALAKPKKLRVMKWREHSPSTSACGWCSSPGVDALCRLSLLFPAVLALAPLRIYSGHSGLPIAPLRNQHFVIPIRSDTDEHLKTIFGCGFHLCFDASRGRHSEWKNSFCLLYA